MSDFRINIDSYLDLTKAKTDMESFLAKYKNETVTINVAINPNSFKTDNIGKQIQNSIGNAGANVGKQFSSNIKNSVTTAISDIQKLKNKLDSKAFNFNSIKANLDKTSKDTLGSAGYSKIQYYIDQATAAKQRFNAELNNSKGANLDSLNADLKEFNVLVNKATSEYNKLIAPASAIKQQKTLNDFLTWGKNNSKAVDAGKVRYDSIVSGLKGSSLTEGQLEDAIGQIKVFKSEMESAGKVGKSFTHEMARGFKQIGQFTLTYGILQKIPQIMMKMVSSVKEVDSAMTSLYKVTDETASRYERFLVDSAKTSKELGRNMSSYIEQTANWTKLGYSLDQSENLAKLSSIYANVGEVSDETAVSDMVTAMKAFNIQASDAVTIIDQLNTLGKIIAQIYSNVFK